MFLKYLKYFVHKINYRFRSIFLKIKTPRNFLVLNNKENVKFKTKITEPFSIAVHCHLFYLDLLDEILHYLKKIPYKFDLFISLNSNYVSKIFEIKNKIRNMIKNVGLIEIKPARNVGRDFAPLFVLFGKKIEKYNYALHIHTKKSLSAGYENKEWRKYLFDGLLKNKKYIKQILALLSNNNIEVFFPDFYEKIPLVCLSNWLEREKTKKFYKKINLEYCNNYLLFSAGSMFWCKPSLFKEIFNLQLQWADFDSEYKEETGLEYVLERALGNLAFKHKANVCVYNNHKNKFYINKSIRLNELLNYLDVDSLKHIIDISNTVSFVLFGSLVCFDKTENQIIESVAKKISDFKLMDSNMFIKIRHNLDALNLENIEAIYDKMFELQNLDRRLLTKIKRIELNERFKSFTRNAFTMEIFSYCNKKNKLIHLIVSSKYDNNFVKKVLNKFQLSNYKLIRGYNNVEQSEIFWKKYLSEEEEINRFHFGSDEVLDVAIPCKLGYSGKVIYIPTNDKNTNFNIYKVL